MAIPTSLTELKQLLSIYSKAIKKALKNYKKVYSVADFSEIKITDTNNMMAFYNSFSPSLKNDGIIFTAFIKPSEVDGQNMSVEIGNESKMLTVAFYDRFENALAAINTLMQNSTPQKSLLSRILIW